jgi:lysophospholipase L1-like esterase
MMFNSSGNRTQKSLIWLVLLAVVLLPSVYALVLGVFWVYDHTPRWVYWEAKLIFLIALEVVYVIAVVAAVVGALASGCWLLRNRPGTTRASLGRRLLVCVSLLLSLLAAEAASAIWQRRAHRSTAMPIGGFRSGPRWRATGFPMGTSIRAPALVEPTLEFDDPPGDREIDLVMVGESSAEGVPFQQWLSIDRIVAWQLQKVIPGRPIRRLSLARSGDTLERQHKRLEGLRRRPDLLIIFCGHNEFKARFSPTRTPDYYFADKLPNTPQLFLNRLEGLSPICGLIGETAEKCRISIPPSLDSTRDLIDVPVYSTTEYTTLLVDFRRRLEAMVSYAERVGAIPVLIAPPANDAGFEPNRSFLPPETPRSEREAFRGEFLAASRLDQGDLAANILRYRKLLESQPGFAETHYCLARLLVRAGALDEAYQHYIAARDMDGYPLRCTTAFQDAYREVASRHGCILIEGQAYLHKIGRQGQLDDDLFQDMMHPSLRGYIALTQAVLQALQARRAFGWPQDVPAPVIDPARCAAHFGLSQETWKHVCLWQKGFNELLLPLRHDRSMRLRNRNAGLMAAGRLSAGATPEALGLPNVGIPAPVPMIPFAESKPSDAVEASMP